MLDDVELDELEHLPPHPRELPTFDCRPSAHPAGLTGYLGDFRAAMVPYYRTTFPVYAQIIPADDHMTEDDYVDERVKLQLRRHVHEAAQVFAERAGVNHRDLSHWLVKSRGYTWRDQCSTEDRQRLFQFCDDAGQLIWCGGGDATPVPARRRSAFHTPFGGGLRDQADNQPDESLKCGSGKAALQLWAGTVGFLADNRRVCRVQCNRTRRR